MHKCKCNLYYLTASKGLKRPITKKTPIDNIPHVRNNHKHSPPYNFPHLLCSAYNLVTLFSFILLAILLQLFLLLFEFIPFRFLLFRACQRKGYRLINTILLQNKAIGERIVIFAPPSFWLAGCFLFLENFASAGFLLSFCAPPSPAGLVEVFSLSVLWGLNGPLPH